MFSYVDYNDTFFMMFDEDICLLAANPIKFFFYLIFVCGIYDDRRNDQGISSEFVTAFYI